MEHRRDVECKSSTSVLIPPPKKAKLLKWSSCSDDKGEESESSFSDGEALQVKERHVKYKSSVEEWEASYEPTSVSFPIPICYKLFKKASGVPRSVEEVREVRPDELRSVLKPAYHLKKWDRRNKVTYGTHLQIGGETHEKEYLRYSPPSKKIRLDVLHEPCRSLSDCEHEVVEEKVVRYADFNSNPMSKDDELNGRSSVRTENAELGKKGKVQEVKKTEEMEVNPEVSKRDSRDAKKEGIKTFWQFKSTKKVRPEGQGIKSEEELHVGRDSSSMLVNSYLKDKLHETSLKDSSADKNGNSEKAILGIPKKLSSSKVSLPREVASYWKFRPVLHKALRIQEKVFSGNGESQPKKSATRLFKKLKKRPPPPPTNQRVSWFQKLLGFFRRRKKSSSKPTDKKDKKKANTEESKKTVEFDLKDHPEGNKSMGITKTKNPEDFDSTRSHKDSKMVLREKRMRLFAEAREFYEDSVMAYKNTLSQLTSEVPVGGGGTAESPGAIPTGLPLPTTALILTSLANMSKKGSTAAASFVRSHPMSGSRVTSSVSEGVLHPVVRGGKSFDKGNLEPPPPPVKPEIRGILKKRH